MALTDIEVKKARATGKPLKLTDGGGLFLLLQPTGAKYWRLAYRYGGKQKTLALGVYPDVSLADARTRRDDARKLLANDTDPGAVKKAQKAAKCEQAANNFEAIAREWFARKAPSWAASNAAKIIQRLDNDAFPWLGDRPIIEITPPELLKVLRRIEERGAVESAHRMRNYCGQIFRYAIATGRADRDVSSDLRDALPPPIKEHRAAITDPKAAAELLRAMDSYQGSFVTKCALRLAPLVFVRPGELRKAEWTEIDLDTTEWNIPADRMKMREPHLVPLSTQAVQILRELHALTGGGRYVFPGARTNGRPMSDNAVLAALRRMMLVLSHRERTQCSDWKLSLACHSIRKLTSNHFSEIRWLGCMHIFKYLYFPQ